MSRRGKGEGSIYRRSDGRWEATSYRRTESGQRRRVSAYGKSREEAHAKLIASLKDATDGIVVPDRAWRLDDYLDHWLPSIKRRCHPTTYLEYVSICKNHLRPKLGNHTLGRLTAPQLQRYFDQQLAAGQSIRTVQKTRTVLSSALTYAWRLQLIAINPARRVMLPTYNRAEITPWSIEQLKSFLAVAEGDRLFPAFLLLAMYGLRQGELLGLRWGDVDFESGVIHVRQQVQRFDGRIRPTELKTRASRRDLPLIEVVRIVLQRAKTRLIPPPTDDDLLFVTQFDNPLEPSSLTRVFHRLTETAGLPRIKLHHLRHTTATLLKDLGVPARDVQTILGHASIITTQQLYQHSDLSGQIAALAKLEQTLRAPQQIGRQVLPSTHVNGPDGLHLLSGGSSQTRTGDTRLFRVPYDPEIGTLTEVKLLARARYLTAIIGAAAVMFCRQDSFPSTPRR